MLEKRTYKEISFFIEKATIEINKELGILYKAYVAKKDKRKKDYVEKKKQMRQSAEKRILTNIGKKTLNEKDNQTKLWAEFHKEIGVINRNYKDNEAFLRDSYLSNCGLSVEFHCKKYKLGLKHMKTIIGKLTID